MIGAETMENIDVKLQEVTDRSLRNEARIVKLEENQKALNVLALSVQELADNQVNMKDDISEIKTDVKALTAIPGKRWDGMLDKAIAVLIGAFIAWLMSGA